MELSREVEVLALLDQVLALPAAERMSWLHGQELATEIRERVVALLALEEGSSDFMSAPAPLPALLAAPLSADGPAAGLAQMMDLPQPGDQLGAWQLLRQLDAGGMGVVYLARRADGLYEQQAALKLVRGDLLLMAAGRRAEMLQRFESERRLLARLDHPNIARILDGGSTSAGLPWLVMEHVDGPPLTDWCARRKLGVRERVTLFARVCDGVQAAHQHLIVHRDLKPGNVLVGSDGQPRLLDFGIARPLAQDDADAAALTRTGAMAMTPAYASPEQLRGEPLTTASDVWSLGVMLYELLAGARPFRLEGLSPAQGERLVCETAPPSLRQGLAQADLPAAERRLRQAGIGSDLERIVAKALHREPARRYGAALALAEDLRRWLAGQPVQAHPDSAGYRAAKFLRRHRRATIAASLALAAIIAAAGSAFWQAGQARQNAADLEQVNRFLLQVLDSSDAYVSGSELTFNEALSDAARQIDVRFGTRPDLAAGVRLAIGSSLLNRHRLEEAQVQLARGLAEAHTAFGPGHVQTLRLRAAGAMLRYMQGDVAGAVAVYEALLQELRDSGRRRDPLYPAIDNDIAYIHLTEEDYERAHHHAALAVAAFERDQVPVAPDDRAAMLGNLAHALDGLGQSQEALAPYQRSRDILQAMFPAGSATEAIVLNNLGLLHRALGDQEQALALLQASADMRGRVLAADHPLRVRALTNVARQALELERLDLAAEAAGEAVAVAARAFSAPTPQALQALVTLADVRLRQGDAVAAGNLLGRARQMQARLPEANVRMQAHLEQIEQAWCADPAAAGAVLCQGLTTTHDTATPR
ncbi:MAG: serine/threonine-protein kinase [Xanthomonadales bacterium]|nr:serine/threonine-protein kinase [Xanthomonadales bacterium]